MNNLNNIKYNPFTNINKNNNNDIIKYLNEYFPNFIYHKNGDLKLINYTLYPLLNINKANYTDLYDNEYIKKYWKNNKQEIIKYFHSNYENKTNENLELAIYNHYNKYNILYFETLIISLIQKYKSKSVLDINNSNSPTYKRLVGCLISGVNYKLISNNINKKLFNLYVKSLQNKKLKYNYEKSKNNLHKLKNNYDMIFIDKSLSSSQSSSHSSSHGSSQNKSNIKLNEIDDYMLNINKKGVLIYLYYNKISDSINKKYNHEIIKFNNQIILTYFKTKPIHKKGKYKYIILSAKVKDLHKYLNKDWSPTYKYTENIDFLYTDGRYKKYNELYNIQTKYANKIILDKKFNIINKIDLYDYIKKTNIKFYNKYLPEQYNLKGNWDEIKKKFKNNKYWIVKPEVGSGGFGIKVFKEFNKMKKYIIKFDKKFEVSHSKKKNENNWLIQKYIDNPLLINNKKFHIRYFFIIMIKNNKLETYFFKKGLIYTSGSDFTMSNLSFDIHNSHGKTTNKKDAALFPDKIKKIYGNENSEKANNNIKNIFNFLGNNLKINCHKESKNCMFIYGVDIIIDNDFNAKLIEINSNTGLLTGIWFMKLKNIFYKDLFNLFLHNIKSNYFIEKNNKSNNILNKSNKELNNKELNKELNNKELNNKSNKKLNKELNNKSNNKESNKESNNKELNKELNNKELNNKELNKELNNKESNNKELNNKSNKELNKYINKYKKIYKKYKKEKLTTNKYVYDYLFSRYNIKLPKNSIIGWCIMYEILYKCKIKFYGIKSTYLNLCSDEEATGYAIDFYFYNMYNIQKELENNISLNLNYKLNTISKLEYFKKKHKNIDIIIYNCRPEFDLEKKYINILNFNYYIENHDINILQFNYIDNENVIITIYYKKSLMRLLNKNNLKNKYANTKLYSKLIKRNNINHKYKLHKKYNPLDHHTHKKIKKEDEKKFINDLFKIFNIDISHKININNSKKEYLKGNINKIKYKNGYSELIIDENKIKHKSSFDKKLYKNNMNIKNYKFIIGSLFLCNEKGTLIIRHTLPFDTKIDNKLIYLLKKCFKDVNFYNTEFIKKYNFIYLICKNYIGYKKANKIINIKKIYNNINLLLSSDILKYTKNNILIKTLKQKIKNMKEDENKNELIENTIEKWFLKSKIKKRKKNIVKNKKTGQYIRH